MKNDVQIWSNGRHYDLNCFRDRVSWNCHNRYLIARDTPRRWKLRLADAMSWWANKLRGNKVFETGYGIKGDRPAFLEDDLRMSIVTRCDQEHWDEMLDRLEELAQWANATWWHPRK